MENIQETNSGAHGGAEQIGKQLVRAGLLTPHQLIEIEDLPEEILEQDPSGTVHSTQSGRVEIRRTYLGKIGEKETIDEVEGACAFAGGDFALEYTGRDLHIFRIMTGVRA